MKKVGIVSCDKWINKIEEDINLKKALNSFGLDARIISWQQPIDEKYDILILRSVWGYQNYFKSFKKWLLNIKSENIPLYNNVDLVLDNIMKDVQFEILRKNKIDYINTTFINKKEFYKNQLTICDNKTHVIKPTISGSGDNTFLINSNLNIPNAITKKEIYEKYKALLDSNEDCKIMVQPFVPEINNGEYSCIFIDGELTHTMLRFPNVFHDKKKPYLITNIPSSILELAKKVESISEFKNYLYMRVDMVLVDGKAKIMEVELAEPDLLTKNIDDEIVKENVIKTFAKKIERRII